MTRTDNHNRHESSKNSKRKIAGTKQTGRKTMNIVLGCPHQCKYCYAKAMARRAGRIRSDEEWGGSYHHLREKEVQMGRRDCGKTVMFPSSHDITPEHLEPCVIFLRKLLESGNRVIIFTKPHLKCINRLCAEFASFREQILFRFTIGALDDAILQLWEPNAPAFRERLACLKHTCRKDFQTSVNIEPMLDVPNVTQLFRKVAPFVTESIWLGKMNAVRHRVCPKTIEMEEAVCRIEENQTDHKIFEIYEVLKHEPLVRWQDSIKEVVGLKKPKKCD